MSTRARLRPKRTWVVVAWIATVVAGAVAVAPAAFANSPVTDGQPLSEFIANSVPEWNFARANNNDTCWPATAIDGNGTQHEPLSRSPWPDTDSGCAPANSPFTTYVSAKNCNDSEIRTSFTLYFPKDGFSPGKLGHDHDFEYIVVVWRKNGGDWSRDRLLMSRHGKNIPLAWSDVESWNADLSNAGLGQEHPRIFVGWGKHAMFNNQAGLKDVVSQFTDNEYRHADYRVFPADQVEVTDDNDVAKAFDGFSWGEASSNPAVVSRNMCGF